MTPQTVARTGVEVIPFKAQIGAEVRCGDVRTLDDAAFRMVHRAFLANLVLLVRGQKLNDLRYTSGGQLRPGYTGKEDIRTAPGPSHPIMRKHEDTGHHALYLGRRPYSYINGLSLEESEALLNEVWAHATQAEFTWSHQWRLGDVLIWDNRCAMHRRDAFDPKSRRIMHRTQCKGTPMVATTAEDLAHLTPHSRAARA